MFNILYVYLLRLTLLFSAFDQQSGRDPAFFRVTDDDRNQLSPGEFDEFDPPGSGD